MKKTKLITLLIVLLLAILAISCTGGAVKNSQTSSTSSSKQEVSNSQTSSSSVEQVTVTDLTLSGQKTSFAFGEEFSSSSLVVTANLSNGSTRVLNTSEYTVDKGSYNSLKAQNHTIKVKLNGTNVEKSYVAKVNVADKIKVLMIGNSFADDTIQWGYEVATSIGINPENVTIADIYIGGCPIDDQWANAQSNYAGYAFRIDQEGSWNTLKTDATMLEAIKYTDWDFITLQQASGSSGIDSTYSNLQKLINYVKSNATNPNVKLIWHQTWAYQADTTHADFPKYDKDQLKMYNAIVASMQSQVLNKDFAAIVPNGTAIQNARTSFIGDWLTRDGYHLNDLYGRYIASLNLVKVLTGRDIADVSWAPNGVAEKLMAVCKESVNNANVNPYEVTNSSYSEINLSNLYKLDANFVGSAYWQCQDAANYNKLITTATNSPNFVATATRFSKTQLPVGSVIKLKYGYKFRSDAWKTEAAQASRDWTIAGAYFEVKEEWWGDNIYRAFNVSKNNDATLSKCYEEALSALEIYVPYQPTTTNSHYEADKNLISNIDNYTRLDISGINGFYDSGTQSNYATVISTNETLSNKFISTTMFNRLTLPVGSYIIIDSGYQYRPEGWVAKDVANSVRPSNVTTNLVEVTETWWGEYNFRAFNVAYVGGATALNQDPYGVLDHFRIYVPQVYTLENLFSGEGTKESPYLISNANDMWNLSYLTMGKNFGDSNLYFKLTSDIDLSGKNWQPICYSGYKNEWPANWYSFNANFNGNGKTITISSSSSVMWGFGLFSGIGGNVSNLIIKGNVVVTGFSGGLAGKLYNGANIQNVTSYVNISATDNQIAGIAGNVNDSAVVTISGCKNYGTVTSTGAQFTAGIIGGGWACVSLADCHNYGAVSGQSFVGGIIGELFVGTWAEAGLTNCTNNATVKAVSTTASTDFGTATLYVGNLVGKNN